MPIKTLFRRGMRFPRLGVIRLGIKVVNAQGKEHPKEVPYFVLPTELQEVLPDRPTSIEVSFPVDDPARVFDPSFILYEGPSLAIKCDGQDCVRIQKTGAQTTTRCLKPEIGQCECGAKALGRLEVIVRKSKVFGTYQVLIGGEGRCRDLMSELMMYAGVTGGLSRAWFTLERVKATEQVRKDDGSRMARTGYPVHLRLNYSPERILGSMVPPVGAIAERASEPAPHEVIEEREAAGDAPEDAERQEVVDELWTTFLTAAGMDSTKASVLSIASVKRHLGRDVGGLSDLTLEEVQKMATIIRPA